MQYPDQSFDYVVLSHTIQRRATRRKVLDEMLRIGRRVVVSLPNFGHLDVRFRLMFLGRMPVSKRLPYSGTIRPTSTSAPSATLSNWPRTWEPMWIRRSFSTAPASACPFSLPWIVWNLLGAQAVFLLSREDR